MNILVINADYLFVNTSANLCHIAYIKGLVDAGHEVDLLSADKSKYKIDPAMKMPENMRCFTYNGMSFYEKVSLLNSTTCLSSNQNNSSVELKKQSRSWASKLHMLIYNGLRFAKKKVLDIYGIHGIYATFVRNAARFHSDAMYDYVISISTPTASHLLAHKLISSSHIQTKHWIQIWEDPWYSDAYGFNSDKRIFREEQRLLSFAEHICYVSPLTLKNQQKLYPESAEKMYWQPLPYYYKNEQPSEQNFEHNTYGYFGAYYPATRNLEPFYQAAVQTGIEVSICGDPSHLFSTTEKVHIYERLPLSELKPIEDSTSVLVFLCNRKGGQIPGKIYQYSATNKTILFIMDGTKEEQLVLKEYFSKFNRYVFCQNTVADITRAIRQIESGDLGNVQNIPLDAFHPVKTITNILEAGR